MLLQYLQMILEPFKLLPHHIELIDGAKPIKQRAYRLSHIQ